MNKDLEFLKNMFGAGVENAIFIPGFLVQILLTVVLSMALGFVYVRYGNALSNRKSLAKTFVLLSLTTMLIITIVKSSLALSLGLVGALSIVRFRTAIKEPEELAYFFIAIAIGLGIGAQQVIPTMIGTVALMLVAFSINRSKQKEVLQNLILQFDSAKSGADFEKVVGILTPHCEQIELKRLDENTSASEISFAVIFNDLKALVKAKDELQAAFPSVTFNFLEIN
jgi:hypothetical protein